ncbi:MAG: hypothetical protein ACLR8L_00020 [Oscillospiraceae bacterium]
MEAVTLAVIGFATAIGDVLPLEGQEREPQQVCASGTSGSLPETYTAEEKARFLEIVLKD